MKTSCYNQHLSGSVWTWLRTLFLAVMMNEVEISIVVPMHNEATNLDALFTRLGEVLAATTDRHEIVCVNDGSTDGTLEALLAARAVDPRIVVVDLSRNFGKEVAVTAGLDHARGQAVIPIDADLQDPPELIADMVARWREGYEVVYARRRSRRGETWFKLATAGLFYRFINRFSEVPIPDNCGDYRLLDRKVVDVVRAMPERVRFNKGLFAWAGFRQTTIEFDRDPRLAGQTSWNYVKLWRLAIDGITSFSAFPLKVWTYVGVVVAFLSFVYGTVLILRTIVLGVDVPGYASLIVIVLFLGGSNLIGIGVLGEYIGRIFDEVKRRPLYVLRDVHGPDTDAGGPMSGTPRRRWRIDTGGSSAVAASSSTGWVACPPGTTGASSRSVAAAAATWTCSPATVPSTPSTPRKPPWPTPASGAAPRSSRDVCPRTCPLPTRASIWSSCWMSWSTWTMTRPPCARPAPCCDPAAPCWSPCLPTASCGAPTTRPTTTNAATVGPSWGSARGLPAFPSAT